MLLLPILYHIYGILLFLFMGLCLVFIQPTSVALNPIRKQYSLGTHNLIETLNLKGTLNPMRAFNLYKNT